MVGPQRILVREIIAAVAAEAHLTPQELRTAKDPLSLAIRARQRAIMLARHLRPDLSWPGLGAMFALDHAAAFEAAGAAAVRWRRGEVEERRAVQNVCLFLGAPVGEIDLASARRRYLSRKLRVARAQVEAIAAELAEIDALAAPASGDAA